MWKNQQKEGQTLNCKVSNAIEWNRTDYEGRQNIHRLTFALSEEWPKPKRLSLIQSQYSQILTIIPPATLRRRYIPSIFYDVNMEPFPWATHNDNRWSHLLSLRVLKETFHAINQSIGYRRQPCPVLLLYFAFFFLFGETKFKKNCNEWSQRARQSLNLGVRRSCHAISHFCHFSHCNVVSTRWIRLITHQEHQKLNQTKDL